MRAKLLQVLAEPVTGAALRLTVTKGKDDRIESGTLTSEATGRVYPILRGIPRFVQDEGYTGSFGRQWTKFREVQLDSVNGTRRSERRFEEEAGWTSTELRGRWLLDAGCGAGRFAEVAAERGAELVALDFSSAVEAAAETLSRFPNADVVQGSLLEPPFRRGAFDFAYCIGVVQHTPDPPAVIRNVLDCVAPSGRFCFTIYGRGRLTPLYSKYLIRPFTRRMPQERLLGAIEALMPFVFPVTDRLFPMPVIGRPARFLIPVASYGDDGQLTREQRYQEAILDTFDMLAPRYDSPMTPEEVEDVLRTAGAMRWEIKSRRPVVAVGLR
jgi:SAM-dependent methyltransferase